MSATVVVDCLPESASRYVSDHAIVTVDVIRATTTVVTAVALGRRCFPVPSIEAARALRRRLPRPVLAGEIGGERPEGFPVNNSPAEVAMRSDVGRPMILLSSSGTRLMHAARGATAAYVACLRNAAATAAYVRRHPRVAVIGAGSRGEFREEDQLCCAWIAADLLRAGFVAGDARTTEVVERWSDASPTACASGRSAAFLRESGQRRDLDFVLAHVNDLDQVFRLEGGEVVAVSEGRALAASAGEAAVAGQA
jgi:2-phosphosulfolactate phosphatase